MAGEPGAWSMTGNTFTFRFTPDLSLRVPTRIALPVGAWSAQCEGCVARVLEGVVDVTASAAEASVTLTR